MPATIRSRASATDAKNRQVTAWSRRGSSMTKTVPSDGTYRFCPFCGVEL